MTVLDQAVLLAGYLLAHSSMNLSFIDEVKVLTPISICLRGGELHTKFHTGKSQAQAIATAKQELAANQDKWDAWAFAREGSLDENDEITQTLSVSAWSSGMGDSVIFIQCFRRSPKFKLIGDPIVGFNGEVLDSAKSKPILAVLRTGISRHEDGGPKWASWH
jgi:hypothetical protein